VRIAVFGSGAVGGYFGGRLAEAGEDVAFIARGEHLTAIRRSGLRVTSIAGDFVVRPARVTDDPSSLGPVDVVLLGVKAWQVPEAVGALQPLVGPRTVVVPLQNGIEAPDRLAAALGVEHVLGGLCRIIGYLVAPGQLRHAGAEPYIAFGPLDPSTRDRAEALRAAFGRARGVVVEIPSDIRAAMWSKFLFIAALSGVGALTRAPVGILRDQPECRRLLTTRWRRSTGSRRPTASRCPTESWKRRWPTWTRCRPTAPRPCSATSSTAVPPSSTRRSAPWSGSGSVRGWRSHCTASSCPRCFRSSGGRAVSSRSPFLPDRDRIQMKKLLGFVGATLGGAVGWWAGSAVGIMTAFMVSTVASGVGLYLGRRLADHYGY
jgi:2-dehydropantoate 2-reductase